MSPKKRNSKKNTKKAPKGQSFEVKSKVLQPKISCFTCSNLDKSIVSPEYKMSQQTNTIPRTRQGSRKQGTKSTPEEQHSDEKQLETDEDEEVTQVTHSGLLPCPASIDGEEFAKLNSSEKMSICVNTINSLCEKLTEMDIAVNHDSDGIQTRVTTLSTLGDEVADKLQKIPKLQEEINAVASKCESMNKKVDVNIDAITDLQAESAIFKGLLQRQSKQLAHLNEKVAMLTVRSQEKNITITNLCGDMKKGEECRENVIQFLRSQVEIDVEPSEIIVAHRLGQHKSGKHRMMLVRCKPTLRKRILDNVSNLKHKTNENEQPYYVNKQLPEMIVEQNKNNRRIIREKKEKEKDLDQKKKTEISVREGKVFFDGKPAPVHLKQVQVHDLFPDSSEAKKQKAVQFASSDIVGEIDSHFQACVTKVHNIQEIRRAYYRMKILHPGADHITAVYINKQHSGFQDDGEYGAGNKILNMLKENYPELKAIAVFIVRNAGITKLGPKRFDCMRDAVKQAIGRLNDYR